MENLNTKHKTLLKQAHKDLDEPKMLQLCGTLKNPQK